MREAGAVILGKTTMPDYGMLSSGLSSFHALSRNPWDLSKGPGGSSAGAGAAAAAGYGPLHVGTDIGGSLRLPAAWCGIFTLKPSLGRIPIDPPYAGRCAGPMTRSVADAALLMGVLARPDERDTMSLPPPTSPGRGSSATCAASRSACCSTPARACRSTPEIAAAVRAAAERFAAAGAEVEPIAPASPAPCSTAWTPSGGCAPGSTSRRCPPSGAAKVLPYIVRWERGARRS